MRAVSEGYGAVHVSAYVAGVGVRKIPLVAMGRTRQAHDHAARRNSLAVELGVARDVAGDVVGRRLGAQNLFDGIGNQGGIVHEELALGGIVGKYLADPADQPVGGVIAGRSDEDQERQHFLTREPSGDALVVFDLDVEQLSHGVVGG